MLENQAEVQHEIARGVFNSVDPGAKWEQLVVDVYAAAGFAETTLYLFAGGAPIGSLDYPDEIFLALLDLRGQMSGPHGTWYSLSLTIQFDGSYSFDFNYDDEPPWRTRPSDETLMLDLEQHPRPPEEIPLWHPARAGSGSS